MGIKQGLTSVKRQRRSQIITDDKGREWSVTPTSQAIRASQGAGAAAMVNVSTKLSAEDARRWEEMLAIHGISSYRMLQRLIQVRLAQHEHEQRIRAGRRAAWRY